MTFSKAWKTRPSKHSFKHKHAMLVWRDGDIGKWEGRWFLIERHWSTNISRNPNFLPVDISGKKFHCQLWSEQNKMKWNEMTWQQILHFCIRPKFSRNFSARSSFAAKSGNKLKWIRMQRMSIKLRWWRIGRLWRKPKLRSRGWAFESQCW